MTSVDDDISQMPVYSRIEKAVCEEINSGRWPVGFQLPGRQKLCAEYGVSLPTMERALRALLDSGVLRSEDRRGTFVAKVVPPESLTSRLSEANGLLLRRQRALTGFRRQSVSQVDDGVSSVDLHSKGANLLVPKTATLGIIGAMGPLDEEETPNWVRTIAGGIENVFAECNGSTMFYNRFRMGTEWPSITKSAEALLASGADALVVIGIYDDPGLMREILEISQDRMLPIACVSWCSLLESIPHVYYDNESAGYQAAQHLLRSGYRRLLYLSPYEADWIAVRLKGARAAVERSGLPGETLVHIGGEAGHFPAIRQPESDAITKETVRQAVHKAHESGMLATPPGNSHSCGIIAPNDDTAIHILDAAGELGLVQGRDYGLIGFDDSWQSLSRGLTTVRPPLLAMGEEAAKLVIRALRGEAINLQIRLQSRIVPRATTSYRQE